MRGAKKRACRVGLFPSGFANRWMGTPEEPTAGLPLKRNASASIVAGQEPGACGMFGAGPW